MRVLRLRLLILLIVLVPPVTACSILDPVEVSSQPSVAANPDEPSAEGAGIRGIRKKILVLPPLDLSGLSGDGGDELKKELAAQLTAALHAIPGLEPIEGDRIEGHEEFILDDESYNYRLIFTKAKAYGASGVLTASIEDLQSDSHADTAGLFRTRTYTTTATVKVELYDAQTERAVLSKTESDGASEDRSSFFWTRPEGGTSELLREKLALQKTLGKILVALPGSARRLAWTGHIAKVDLQHYYINAGEASGISIGQLLKVFDESKAISDPQTGLLIGMAPGYFKGILKVIGHFGNDGAIAVVHSGGGFRELDRVEVYSPPEDR